MKQVQFLTVACIFLFATIGNSQTVASLGVGANFSSFNTIAVSHLTYDVVEAETNVLIETIDYSAASQQLSIGTGEDIQFISIFKDGELYLTKMPVMSSNLNFSIQNYEAGNYELHLLVAGKVAPTIIEISKD